MRFFTSAFGRARVERARAGSAPGKARPVTSCPPQAARHKLPVTSRSSRTAPHKMKSLTPSTLVPPTSIAMSKARSPSVSARTNVPVKRTSAPAPVKARAPI